MADAEAGKLIPHEEVAEELRRKVGDGRRVVLWTRAARDSLDEILAFIALDSPAVASKVAKVVLGAADLSRCSPKKDASFPRRTRSRSARSSSIGIG
jgi:plasmid stabilization system protein ParE